MSGIIFFVVVLSVGLCQALSNVHGGCEVSVDTSSSPCSGLMLVDRPCNESTADFGRSTLKSCDVVDVTWMYPMRNLTITIETSYTQQHQEYSIRFDNRPFYQSSFKLYRILNGQETRINTSDEFVTEKSDSKFQIILKMQAPYTISRYVLDLDYKVTKL